LDSNALNLRARQRILENFTVAHLGDKTERVLIQSLERDHKRMAPSLRRVEEVHPPIDA
jgi:Mn-dependent DtxR family transcriptional regulator